MIYYQNLLHFWFKKVIFISRSYKRTPRCGDKKDKYLKNYANRRLRRYPIDKPPLNNCTYKKYNCSWDICDYETVATSFEEYWERLIRNWYNWGQYYGLSFPDRQKAKKDYYRFYRQK